MSVFVDIIDLLTVSPGGMVYYLVLLFSIWALVGLALSRWSRDERRGIVPRLLVAAALMSLGRMAFFVIALLDRDGGAFLIRFGPPLERFVDTVSGLLIVWALVIPPRHRTAGLVFIGVTSFFALGAYVIAAVQWAGALQADSGVLYNVSWQRWMWELGQLAFLVPAIVYLFVSPAQERGTLIVGLSILVVGHLLQAVLPAADQVPHFAGWVRFANLIVYPLLAVSVFRLIVQRFDAQAMALQTVNQDSLAQIAGLMDLLDTHQKMSASLDLDVVLDNTVRGVAQALQANLCGVALLNQEPTDEMELSIVYLAPDATRGHQRFAVGDYPAIQHAITRNKPVILEPGENGRVSQVYRLLGSEQTGPLIIHPLSPDSGVIGALLVCRPGQSAPFTVIEIRKCETMAPHTAESLDNARQYKQMTERIRQLDGKRRALETGHSRARADLENRLKHSQEEIALYVQKLYETEASEQQAQNNAKDAHGQLNKLRKESAAALSLAQAESQRSTEALETLQTQFTQVKAQCTKLEGLVQSLEQDKGSLLFRLAETEGLQPGPESGITRVPADGPPADERTQARDEFLAALAQDLRTPMTSILGYTELLMNESVGQLEGIQRKFLQRVQSNIERMGGMLNDLMGVTAIDSGKLTVEFESVDIIRVIEGALRKAQFRLEEKELNTKLEVGDLPTIAADPECVQQMVDNLLTNACKSSPVGSTIGVQAFTETDDAGILQLHVAVSDTGGGIDSELQDQVFERFYRAENALIAGLGETGVGLSIVKALVEAHHGRVWIESEPGVGTTFHFTLPVRQDQPTSDEVDTEATASEIVTEGNGDG